MWFTFSEKIEIRAVDNDDIFRHIFLVKILVSKLLLQSFLVKINGIQMTLIKQIFTDKNKQKSV